MNGRAMGRGCILWRDGRKTVLDEKTLKTKVPEREVVHGLPQLARLVQGDGESRGKALGISREEVSLPPLAGQQILRLVDELAGGVFFTS